MTEKDNDHIPAVRFRGTAAWNEGPAHVPFEFEIEIEPPAPDTPEEASFLYETTRIVDSKGRSVVRLAPTEDGLAKEVVSKFDARAKEEGEKIGYELRKGALEQGAGSPNIHDFVAAKAQVSTGDSTWRVA